MSKDIKMFNQDIEQNTALPIIFQNLNIEPALVTSVNTENQNTMLDIKGMKYKKYECYKPISKIAYYER